MHIDRQISTGDIFAARAKGTERAQKILERVTGNDPKDLQVLSPAFDNVARCTNMLLDNFSPHLYVRRGHPDSIFEQKLHRRLRNMLLTAYDNVHCLGILEERMQQHLYQGSTESRNLRQAMLLQQSILTDSVHVYKENGGVQVETNPHRPLPHCA